MLQIDSVNKKMLLFICIEIVHIRYFIFILVDGYMHLYYELRIEKLSVIIHNLTSRFFMKNEETCSMSI